MGTRIGGNAARPARPRPRRAGAAAAAAAPAAAGSLIAAVATAGAAAAAAAAATGALRRASASVHARTRQGRGKLAVREWAVVQPRLAVPLCGWRPVPCKQSGATAMHAFRDDPTYAAASAFGPQLPNSASGTSTLTSLPLERGRSRDQTDSGLHSMKTNGARCTQSCTSHWIAPSAVIGAWLIDSLSAMRSASASRRPASD
jgi:hypothetical protein